MTTQTSSLRVNSLAERIVSTMRKKTAELRPPKMKATIIAPEQPDQPPMILLSGKVPMGTRYVNRGSNKRIFA